MAAAYHFTQYKFVAFFFCLYFFSFAQAQEKEEKGSKILVETQALYLITAPEDVSIKGKYDLDGSSRIVGANTSVLYEISDYLYAGAGIGYEHLTQPDITYHPIYAEIRLAPDNDDVEDFESALGAKINFGTHLGKLDKNGLLLRAALTYCVPIGKRFASEFELILSYQGFEKRHPNATEAQSYNLKSFGLGANIRFK